MELFYWPSFLLFSGNNRNSVCWKILQDSNWIGSEESSGKLFGISWRHLCPNTFSFFAQHLLFCVEGLEGQHFLSKENPLFSNSNCLKVWCWCRCICKFTAHPIFVGFKQDKFEMNIGGDLIIVISMTCGNKCYLLNLDHFKKGRAQCIGMAAVVGVRW